MNYQGDNNNAFILALSQTSEGGVVTGVGGVVGVAAVVLVIGIVAIVEVVLIQ